MNQFEIFFDGLYLSLVIFLGIRMLLINHRDSLTLGSMTLLLGLGDSFHLVPRIIANVMDNGFAINSTSLFVGTRVSSITMSVFYLLFYFYIKKTKDLKNKGLDLTMLVLFALRVLTVFISFKGDGSMDLISNLPFVMMGLVDIVLLFKNRSREEFRRLYIYVFFSFLFYIPVVLFKNIYPTIGMLMMPKTVMYVLIVLKLYKNLQDDFVKRDLMEYAFAYLLSGILVGASYRELGKVFEVTKYMSLAHTHLIVLGFALPGIFYLLVKNSDLSDEKTKKLFNIYNFGIYLAFTSMIIHGLVDPHLPMRLTEIGLISISGVGHILLTISIVLLSVNALRSREIKTA